MSSTPHTESLKIKLFEALRPGADSQSTSDGRSRERYRRIALSSLASAAVRATSLITTIAIVPLTVRYLGAERYGLWMAITSAVAILSFSDLGMSSGLINAVAQAYGKNDRTAAARYVSTTFFLLCAAGFVLGAAFLSIYQSVPWDRFFNVATTLAANEAGPAMAILVACFLLGLPLGVAQRVLHAYQEGFKASLWSGLGSVLGLVGVLVAIRSGQSLAVLVFAFAGGPLAASALNSIHVFFFEHRDLLPRLTLVTGSTSATVMRISFLYFVLSIAAAVGYQSDNLIIARILGADSVTPYSVTMRLFGIAPLILSFVLAPLWPAYGEALARGDSSWVRKTFRRSIGLGLAINIPFAALLLVTGRTIIEYWAGPDVVIPFALLVGFALWTVLNALSGPFAMFLNGAGVVRFQVIWSLVMAIANICLSILLVRRVGVAGAILGSILAQSLFLILPIGLRIKKLLHQIDANPPSDPAPDPLAMEI